MWDSGNTGGGSGCTGLVADQGGGAKDLGGVDIQMHDSPNALRGGGNGAHAARFQAAGKLRAGSEGRRNVEEDHVGVDVVCVD